VNEVLLDRHGDVAVITLNRPDHGNAIDAALARSLLETVLACAADANVRCVLLTGSGRMFCVGGDVKAFAAAGGDTPALVTELTTFLHAAIVGLLRMDKPLVTAINGAAAGAGFGLAIMGDVALASSASSFSTAYGLIGLTRLVGLRHAQEIALANRRLDATEAVSIGLVTRAVDAAALFDAAMAAAAGLAASSVTALASTRELLFSSYGATLEEQLGAEARMIARSAGSEEAQALIHKFAGQGRSS
jgi:2-(1,2-epoxy-1,2-dihydrophenyl)acetyl-CoA isomerase